MKKLPFVLAISMTAGSVFSQTNFSGNWSLKEKQLISGPNYANSIPKSINVIQDKDSLIIETISTSTNGEDVKSTQSLPMNGEMVTNISPQTGRKLNKTLKWSANKEVLTLTTVIHKADAPSEVELTRIETWTIEPGSHQLTINKKSIETVSENWEARATFEKK